MSHRSSLAMLLGVAGLTLLSACESSVLAPPPSTRDADADASLAGSIDYMKPVDGPMSVRSATANRIAAPQSAARNDITNNSTVFRTDFTSAGIGYMRDNGSGTLTLSGVSGTVTKAILYWHGPTNSSSPTANAFPSVDGTAVAGQNIGFSNDNCWGYANSQAYSADVTAIVAAKGNGAYQLTGFGRSSVNTNGASLVVFYNDGNTANDRDVVIFQGNDSNIHNSFDADGWNVTLAGITYSSGAASMQLHVADGQIFPDANIFLNHSLLAAAGAIFQGNSVQHGNGPDQNGGLWDIRTFDVTAFLTPGDNTLSLQTGVLNDCLALVVALVDLPAGAAPEQPDDTPPEIAVDVTGDYNSASNWYRSDVGITWTVTDAESPVTAMSGCDAVTISTDAASLTYTCSATSTGGTATRSTTIRRDATKPVIGYTGNAGSYTVDQSVAITCSASDALSGLASNSCANITGDAYTFALGNNNFSANATDNAGNGNSAATSFVVTVTRVSLCSLVERWVDKPGVAHSLCVKLEHGNYEPFRHELDAQTGKSITPSNALILQRLVNAL